MFLLSLLIPLALGQEATSDPLAQVMKAQAQTYSMTRPSPGIHFSPRAAAAYAVVSGCVPAVMTGRPATEFFQTAASRRGVDEDGRYTVSVQVHLKEEANGACTVTSTAGEPAQLREAVLSALDDLGAVRTTAADTGAYSLDSIGSFRQELHCLTLNDQALFLVLSTSAARNRPKLQASLGRDVEGSCPRRSDS
ncbi:hypothetical protein [Brevundimonas sp.]|uniref:hypothetical protein n=1 Tax=Brevundimonas sp. TaxID=1871086 RepID=UPI00286C19ED|nr:hypothetical protein [Brevundimonas sp.]